MGFHRSSLIAAPLLLVLPVAAPAWAQDAGQGDPIVNLPSSTRPPSSDPRRQGPELDVFRDVPGTAQPATPPPLVVTPTITPTPAPTPSQPAPSASTAPQRQPQRQAPPAPEAEQRAVRPRPAPVAPAPESADEPAANTSAPPVAPAETSAPDTPGNSISAAPVAEPALEPAEQTSNWPWIAGAIVLVLAAAAFFFLRKRNVAQDAVETVQPVTPAPRPAPPAPPTLPSPPTPVPPAPEPIAPTATTDPDRPWIDMELEVTQARLSLLGVTITYSLIFHNRGERTAQDVMVRGVVGNAGPQQQAVLDAFFTGQTGMPLHSAVAIAPNETQRLSGELRLATEEIAAVQMGERSLLIPIAAFDAAYRWDAEGEGAEPQGHGRTARAFIVGQDQDPPVARLAPLRLDQGFRQYRRPAARAAAELTPS